MEKAYFPMDIYNLSQGYGKNTYSHKNNLAMDICGNDTGIDKAFAPFTGTIKKTYATQHQVWLASNDKVLCSDGVERYLVMLLAHDNDISDLKVGQVIKQGEYFYQEGTYSTGGSKVTGNHIHMELGEGKFEGTGWFKNNAGVWQINNPLEPDKVLFLRKGTNVKNSIHLGKTYAITMEKEEESIEPTPKPQNKPIDAFKMYDAVLPIELVNWEGTKLKQYDEVYYITAKELENDTLVLSAKRNGKYEVWARLKADNVKKL